MKRNLESGLKKCEEKIRPEPTEHYLVIWEGEEDVSEEKKKKILAENPNVEFIELHIKWAD